MTGVYVNPLLVQGQYSIHRDPESGALFGLIQGRKVIITGVSSSLSEKHFHQAKEALANCKLAEENGALTVQLKLMGGGSKGSKMRRPNSAPAPASGPAPTATVPANRGTEIVLASHWSVPKKNGDFVGREKLLSDISKQLKSSSKTILAGTGGMGKTSVACEYLYRHRNDYPFLVWWISADSPMNGFLDLGIELGVAKVGDKAQEVVEAVKGYLESQSNWCLVFDNAEKPADLQPFLPSKGGHILITSRNPHWQESINVDVFAPEESKELLTRLTGQPEAGSEALAELLGHLPLALTQAGSYIKTTQTSYAGYIDLFEQVRRELWQDETAPKDYSLTVGTTWKISVEKIRGQLPEALEVLYKSAYLYPNNIPSSLLIGLGEDELGFQKKLHILQSYSLLVAQDAGLYSLHRLIQTTTRDDLKVKQTQEILHKLLDAFKKEWVFNTEDLSTWESADTLVEHLKVFCTHIAQEKSMRIGRFIFLAGLGNYFHFSRTNLDQAALYANELIAMYQEEGQTPPPFVLLNLGRISLSQGNYAAAVDSLSRASALSGDGVEQDLTLTVAIEVVLGNAYLAQGEMKKAERCFKKALERADTTSHQSVAGALLGMAKLLALQGDSVQATTCMARAFEEYKQAYGEESYHLCDIYEQNGVNWLSQDPPQFALALECFQKGLELTRKTLGEKHLKFGMFLSTMGKIHHGLGNDAEAIRCHTQEIEIYKACLKMPHPVFISSYSGLGMAYQGQGNKALAIQYCKTALEISEALAGGDTPQSIETELCLSEVYIEQKNYDEAFKHTKAAIEGQEKLFGKRHPLLIKSYLTLGTICEDQNNLDLAERYLILASELCAEHNKPFDSSNGFTLGNVYFEQAKLDLNQGKHQLAIDKFLKALELFRKYEENGKSLAVVLLELADTYERLKDPKEIEYLSKYADFMRAKGNLPTLTGVLEEIAKKTRARGDLTTLIKTLEELVTIRRAGGDTVKLTATLHELATLYLSQQAYARALPHYKEFLEVMKRSLGGNHPHVALAYYHLGICYMNTSELDTSIQHFSDSLRIYEQCSPQDVQAINRVTKGLDIAKQKKLSTVTSF